jgi:hypothetical protein
MHLALVCTKVTYRLKASRVSHFRTAGKQNLQLRREQVENAS